MGDTGVGTLGGTAAASSTGGNATSSSSSGFNGSSGAGSTGSTTGSAGSRVLLLYDQGALDPNSGYYLADDLYTEVPSILASMGIATDAAATLPSDLSPYRMILGTIRALSSP